MLLDQRVEWAVAQPDRAVGLGDGFVAALD